jgi:hypothetical protein
MRKIMRLAVAAMLDLAFGHAAAADDLYGTLKKIKALIALFVDMVPVRLPRGSSLAV